jgi:hypothetical protein
MPREAHELDRSLDSLGAAVREEDVVEPRRRELDGSFEKSQNDA